MSVPDEYDLYWGDFHKHVPEGGSIDRIDDVVVDAKEHLDVYPVLCYPFEWQSKGDGGSIGEETVGDRPEFNDWWAAVEAASAKHNDPGEFVTFPAYEWNGNRTRWGDRNVIYFEEGYPLDSAWSVAQLNENLMRRRAFAIPHHTAYQVGNRGQDWDHYDPVLSPVTEVYSTHGSSEAVDTPVPMAQNADMGPRTSGGTYRDALDRGHRVGAIASNDLAGLPGTWGKGVAGVWAESLTRGGIWEALESRRTYGVTGDRIELWWTMNGEPMGSVLKGATELEASVSISSPRPLRHVELVHNGRVSETYSHHANWDVADPPHGRCSVLVEFGWGPNDSYGDFDRTAVEWDGELRIDDGTLVGAQPRLTGFGQRYEVFEGGCEFKLVTDRRDGTVGDVQGFHVTLDATPDSELVVHLATGERWVVPIATAVDRSHLFVRHEQSVERIETDFGLSEDDIENPDVYFHNAPKVMVHPVYPRAASTATVTFEPPVTGDDYYYVRASQIDGQYAWSSPIWVEQ